MRQILVISLVIGILGFDILVFRDALKTVFLEQQLLNGVVLGYNLVDNMALLSLSHFIVVVINIIGAALAVWTYRSSSRLWLRYSLIAAITVMVAVVTINVVNIERIKNTFYQHIS